MKYYLLFACLIGTILISGCINPSFDATEIAKANQAVKSFLADYPNARVIASYVSNANISSECENPQLAAKDYWKVSIFDEATKLTVNVWVDATTRNVVCLIKTGGGTTTTTTTTTITTTTIIETTTTTEERVHGGSGGNDPCKGVVCKPVTNTCPDNFIVNCLPICNSTTGACETCNPDCSRHIVMPLVKTFEYFWKNGSVGGIALDDSYLYISLDSFDPSRNQFATNQSEINMYEKGSWNLKTTLLLDSPWRPPDITTDEYYIYACGSNGTYPTLYIWRKDGTRIAKSVIEYIKPGYSARGFMCEKIVTGSDKVYLLISGPSCGGGGGCRGYVLIFDKSGNRLNTIESQEDSNIADMKIDNENIYLKVYSASTNEMHIWDKDTLTLKYVINFSSYRNFAVDNEHIYVALPETWNLGNSYINSTVVLNKKGSLVTSLYMAPCTSISVDDTYLYCGTSNSIIVNEKTPIPTSYGMMTLKDIIHLQPSGASINPILSDQNYVYAYSYDYNKNTALIQVWKK